MARPTPDEVGPEGDPMRQLTALGTSTVYEASGVDCFLSTRVRAAWRGAVLVGPAYTVQAKPGDNLAIHRALREAVAGDVLVVDAGGAEYGHFGEVMAELAVALGIAGLLIDGTMRDIDEIEALGLPVFSTGISMRSASKRDAGVLGEKVTVGDRDIEPGDIVVADADGVLALPRAMLDETLVRAWQRYRDERAKIAQIRDGVVPPLPS